MGEGNGAHGVELFTPPTRALAWLRERAAQRRGDTDDDAGAAMSPVDTEELGLFGVLLRSSVDSIILNDRETEWILEVSDSFEALTGYGRDELVGRTSLELGLVEADEGQDRSRMRAQSSYEGTHETQLLCKDGRRLWAEFSQQFIGDDYVLTILRDVTDRKHLEDDLRMLAELDELTGIYNRRRFQEEVEKHLRASKRFGDPLTLLLLDVDGFKQINDTYGHAVGDQALQVVARALRGAVRETDLVGRLGGDEFVALLTRGDARGVDRVVGAFRRSLRVEDAASAVSFSIEASIGIARSDGRDETYENLLRRADRAMYAEKNTKGS